MSDTLGPHCIGVILDGNRRFAKENNLPQLEGHRRGLNKIKELLEWAHEDSIKHVVVYAFSTENWNRSEEEISYLMDLFEEYALSWSKEVQKQGGRIRFIGERNRLRSSVLEKMENAEELTKEGAKGTLWVCLSYGGRPEIIAAVNRLLKEKVREIDEITFRQAMWSAEMPDPDLIIRTGGEKRLSNFLTWQSIYSELLFTDTKLPALTKEEFNELLIEFKTRTRRHGR